MSPKMSIAILLLVIGMSHGEIDPTEAHKAWQDYLDRLAAIDRLYPSRYGLAFKEKDYPINFNKSTATGKLGAIGDSSRAANVHARGSRSLLTEDNGPNEE